MKLTQHTVCLYRDLERRLPTSLIGRVKGQLGISPKEYKAKTKKAEERRVHNRRQARSYYNSLEREIEAALFGVVNKEDFLIDLETYYDTDRSGWIKNFRSYKFRINPSAVSTEGTIAARKKEKTIAIVGNMAKQSLEKMVQEVAKESGLRATFFATPKDAPTAVQAAISAEAGLLICGTFYPLITRRRTRDSLTFRSQKDLRRAILDELAPEYSFLDDSWNCSVTEIMKIQRSVNTTIDWSLDSLERTKELDHKLKTAHDSLEGAYARLPRTSDFTSLLSKIEAVRGELAEIEKEYKESKSEWRKALIMKSKNPSLSFSMQDEAVRKIEDCGRRIESTILPGLEDALKSDARISKLEPIKQALNKTAYAIDWVQRMVFLAGAVMAAFPPKPI